MVYCMVYYMIYCIIYYKMYICDIVRVWLDQDFKYRRPVCKLAQSWPSTSSELVVGRINPNKQTNKPHTHFFNTKCYCIKSEIAVNLKSSSLNCHICWIIAHRFISAGKMALSVLPHWLTLQYVYYDQEQSSVTVMSAKNEIIITTENTKYSIIWNLLERLNPFAKNSY